MWFSRSTHLLIFLSLEALTSIMGTDLPVLVELIGLVNSIIIFSVSNDLTRVVSFPTRIPGCGSHGHALLDLFISSDASICSTMAFPPLGNSDHVNISVSIDFSSHSQRDTPFHRIAYGYSRADWMTILVPIEAVFVIIIISSNNL